MRELGSSHDPLELMMVHAGAEPWPALVTRGALTCTGELVLPLSSSRHHLKQLPGTLLLAASPLLLSVATVSGGSQSCSR